jgi:hypothetical protein
MLDSQCLHMRVLYLALVDGELPGVVPVGSSRTSCEPCAYRHLSP